MKALYPSFASPETWRNPGQTKENGEMYNEWFAYHSKQVKLSQNQKLS